MLKGDLSMESCHVPWGRLDEYETLALASRQEIGQASRTSSRNRRHSISSLTLALTKWKLAVS